MLQQLVEVEPRPPELVERVLEHDAISATVGLIMGYIVARVGSRIRRRRRARADAQAKEIHDRLPR